MVSRQQRRTALRKKLQILRTLTSSQSVKVRSVIMDALLHISRLRLKLEAMEKELKDLNAIKREYLSLMKQVQLPKKQVKVEKAEEGVAVRVLCEKGSGDKLVSILEVFEGMSLVVLHARVSTNFLFTMEAIVVAPPDQGQDLDVNIISQAILMAIER
ncbi:hypothetical protein Tsubulata_017585 [Turnera subulata]|uniref:Plant bHLH transcription factor ACT-like domain-containing protein n=1 Tax=Turnera subulata TaxID=218843 RepID=A0A9Q0G6A8_9ROSI|nr:hypothetical protein Tsubulata_017585 [Turnera subulata]